MLRSIDVGALFLDHELRVRRYNDTVLRVLPLRSQDVGRELSDLVLQGDYPSFIDDVSTVLASSEPTKTVFTGTDGTRWSVQIRPFDQGHRHAGGVIVMFHDQTAWMEREVRIGELTANKLAAGMAGVGMVLVDPKAQSTRPSEIARHLLGLEEESELNYDMMKTLLTGAEVENGRGENTSPIDSLREHLRPDGTKIMLRVFAQRLVHEDTGSEHVLVALQRVRT